MTSPLLEVYDLQVGYGGIRAIKGINLHVAKGELVALIGSNGAGKTTTLKTLAGLLHPASGQIQYDGKSLRNVAAHQRAAMGIALVPEGRGVFARMTVAENLLMGAYSRSDKNEISADLERMYGLFPRLAERKEQLAGTLSGGEQQMVAMARALMSRPRLLMLDEPSMGLAPLMVQKIFATIRDIATLGMSILLVEQNARLALQVAQRGYVMESGASAEIAVVGREGVVGISLFMGGESTPGRAVVQSAGKGYRLTSQTIKEEFNRAPVLHLLLRYTQALITQMAQTAVCNRHHSLDQQLCRWLLLSMDRLRGDELVMTQELIANMLGVRREGVTEAAGKLQKAGLVRYTRGRITVLDREGLEKRSCECYEVVKKEYDRLLPARTAT